LGSLDSAIWSRLASCLVGVGDLTVYDVHEPSREAFRGRARVAGSVAETGAGADVVGLCVRTGEQVRECADAVLPVMREGGMLMIHSTVSPDLVLAVARDWPAAGFQKTRIQPAGRRQTFCTFTSVQCRPLSEQGTRPAQSGPA